MIVAVTGATGIVGRFVCEHLAELGHDIRALRRPASDTGGFVHSPQWVVGDLNDTAALQQLLRGADAVVHCAFSHAPGRYRGGEGDDPLGFWQSNLGGTLRLLEAAEHAQASRVVLLSSRAVFARRLPGEDPHAAVDDDHPLWPDTHYGALKVAQEAVAAAYTNLCVSALRPTGVYGLTHPLQHSKWFALVDDVLQGKPVTVSRTATEVHGIDVATAIAILLQAPAGQVQGRGFNCSDITVSTRTLVSAIADRADLQVNLPPESPPVVNPMRCDALRGLNWQPGGEPRLHSTLDSLVKRVLTLRQ